MPGQSPPAAPRLPPGCSVEWDPTGERADRIRREAVKGVLRPDASHQPPPLQQPAAGPSQATPFPASTPLSVHRPETQVTPLVHWSAAPAASQMAEAGVRARPAAAALPASQAQQSQAPPRAAGGGEWMQLAKEALALLEPQGVSRTEAVLAMKPLGRDKAHWLAAGARALAAEVLSRLGRADVQLRGAAPTH